MTQNHQRFQQNQYQSTSKPHESHRPPNRSSLDQRRELILTRFRGGVERGG